VKKKVDSYISSGLLAQVPCLPPIECPEHCESSSVMNQQNIEDSCYTELGEVEDSFGSQSSLTEVYCSQVQNTNVALISDLHVNVDAIQRDEQNSSMCQGACYTSTEAVASALPDVHYHVSCMNFDLDKQLEEDFDQRMSLQTDSDEVPNNATFEVNQALCGTANQEMSLVPIDITQEMHLSMLPNVSVAEQKLHSISNCLESDLWHGISLQSLVSESGNDTVDADLLLDIPISGPLICSDSLSDASEYRPDPKEMTDPQDEVIAHSNNPAGDAEQSVGPSSSDDRQGASMMVESLAECGDQELIDAKEPVANTEKEKSPQKIENEPDGKTDECALFYRPPKFPSLDDPFVSCDLVPSDDLQDFSPFGMRQLMRSTMDSVPTPLRLWGCQTHDENPNGLLAAESFGCTPSVMKKRHRDLLSPTPDKRIEKKSGTEKDCLMFATSHMSIATCSKNATPSCKEVISSKSKPAELIVEKLSPCINASYEYVNM
jgi:transcriptional activator Myb